MLDDNGIERLINVQAHFDYIEGLFHNRKKLVMGYIFSIRKHDRKVCPSLRIGDVIPLSHTSKPTSKIILIHQTVIML